MNTLSTFFSVALVVVRVLAGILLCPFCSGAAAPVPGDQAARTHGWEADIDYFARQLPAVHKDFYKLMPKDDFERQVAELRRALPQLTDAEIILRLERIVAALGVAHTRVGITTGWGARTFHRYPVRLQWFIDDLAVVAATPQYKEALGCRVLRLGTLTPAQAETTLLPYIAKENRARLHRESPRFMVLSEVMRREKITGAEGRLPVTCAKADGSEFTLYLKPAGQNSTNTRRGNAEEAVEPDGDASREDRTEGRLLTVREALQIPTEFCLKHQHPPYWYEYLPEANTLYVQYNICRDVPTKPFGTFVTNLFVLADSKPARRVVVDLRFNGGGSSSAVNPLLHGLKARPSLSAKGHLYVLTGPGTFSSAVITAHRFRSELPGILVGEPPANKPNHYGSVGSFVLPNSQLKINYSEKLIHLIRNSDPETLVPDILVPHTLADYLAGRDRVLETALHRPL